MKTLRTVGWRKCRGANQPTAAPLQYTWLKNLQGQLASMSNRPGVWPFVAGTGVVLFFQS